MANNVISKIQLNGTTYSIGANDDEIKFNDSYNSIIYSGSNINTTQDNPDSVQKVLTSQSNTNNVIASVLIDMKSAIDALKGGGTGGSGDTPTPPGDLSGYITTDVLNNTLQDYVKSNDQSSINTLVTNGRIITEDILNNKGFITEDILNNKGFITNDILNNKGFITNDILNTHQVITGTTKAAGKASSTAWGHVILEDNVTSTNGASTGHASTPLALNNHRLAKGNATTGTWGHVLLTDTVSTTYTKDSGHAVSPKGVYEAIAAVSDPVVIQAYRGKAVQGGNPKAATPVAVSTTAYTTNIQVVKDGSSNRGPLIFDIAPKTGYTPRHVEVSAYWTGTSTASGTTFIPTMQYIIPKGQSLTVRSGLSITAPTNYDRVVFDGLSATSASTTDTASAINFVQTHYSSSPISYDFTVFYVK